MSDQHTNEASTAEAGDRAHRARQRRARDEQLLAQAATGDAGAYRQLVDAWTPGAFDRALHRGADERSAAEAVVRTFSSVQNELDDTDASFGARIMGAIERDVPARPRALGKATRGAKRAGERLTRGTDPAALGADPSISAMCWDALDVLGDRARDITDLHWRHGLAPDEIAAATGESVFRVDDILRKAPQGLAAALRTRLLWAGGKPDHDELTKDLKANNVRQFDSTAVRVIHAHLRACSVCRSRSLIALPAIDVFAAIPLVAVPGELERRIGAIGWSPMGAAAAGTVAAASLAAAPAEAEAVEAEAVEPEPVEAEAIEPEPVEAEPIEPEPVEAEAVEPEPVEAEPVEAGAGTTAAPTSVEEPVSADGSESTLETRPTEPEPEPAASNGARAAAGTAAAAFLGAGAASALVDAPAVASPLDAPAPPAVEPLTTGPAPAPPAPPAPLETNPLSALARPAPAPTAPAEPAPPPPPPPSEPVVSGPAHEPVASRAADRPGRRPKWLVPACVAVAAVIVLGLVMVFTRGDDTQTAIDAGPVVETTTTSRVPSSSTTTTRPPTTTTTAPATTQAPTTLPAGGGGNGGGGGGGGVTTTTKAAAIIANVYYDVSPSPIRVSDMGGASLTWDVTANGPITVSVTGPGVSSGSQSGQATVCANGSCGGAGTYYFSIVAKDLQGRQVGAGTAKLIIRQ